jgi:hypothetical protein
MNSADTCERCGFQLAIDLASGNFVFGFARPIRNEEVDP